MSISFVSCENLPLNPQCPHGPTLKFSRNVKGVTKNFFACSTCRDRKDCPFFMWEGEKMSEAARTAWEKMKKDLLPNFNHNDLMKRLATVKSLPASKRQYCSRCNIFVLPSEKEHEGHPCFSDLSNDSLQYPLRFLVPLSSNKKEAQYIFTDSTVQFIVSTIRTLNFKTVLCIGTPRVHEVARLQGLRSLLLDIDHRLANFFSPAEFCWFNMFNFYFFEVNGSKEVLEDTLKSKDVCVVMDPPFGARLEPLSTTHSTLQKLHSHLSNGEGQMKTMLILPYFMEPHVLEAFDGFKITDFPVEYNNHKKFKKDHKKNPVRIFTDIEPKHFKMVGEKGFWFCEDCQRWSGGWNKHCSLCNSCTSKDGTTYVHCYTCNTCVKASWKHCVKCDRCALPSHICGDSVSEPELPGFRTKRRK